MSQSSGKTGEIVASQARLFRAVAELTAREFSRWSNSGKSSSSSCDSRAVSSATARKSLACEAREIARQGFLMKKVRWM